MARKHLLAITAVAVLALLASACGASGGDKQADDGDKPTTTAAAQEAAAGSFGDLPAPVCGPGKDKVADGEGVDGERFELVVLLISHVERERLRLRVQVPETDPTVPTLFEVHPGAEAPEREVFDMFGIAFEGHPDLTRILMPEDWDGHPLRKDYGIGRIPVQFKDAPA